MFDQGPQKTATPAVNSETVRDPQAIKAINDTIANLRNNPDQVADYANNLMKSIGQQSSSAGQSDALGKVTNTIGDVKEQTLGIGRDVPLESIDLNHADNRHYAHQMAEELIQELTFLLPSLERENKVDLDQMTFSPSKSKSISVAEGQKEPLGQEEVNERRFGEDLSSLLGESFKGLDLELPLRESIANSHKESQEKELGNMLNQEEHRLLRDEELGQLQALPDLEELDPLEIVSRSTENLLVKSVDSAIEEFDTQVRNVTVDTGDSSDDVRTALAAEINPFSWETAA